MKLNPLFLLLTIVLFCSCGVITKARYGNGLKINLETRLFSKHTNTDQSKKTTFKSKRKPTQMNEKIDSVIFVAEEFHIEEPETNTLQNISESPVTVESQIEKTKDKTSIKSKLLDLKKEISLKKLLNPIVKKQVENDGYRPYERNAKWGAILFFGGLIIPYCGILIIPGFVLSIIALGNIRRSNFAYRGYGLAVSVIVLFIITLILSLIFLALFLAILL
jgi:hypothetical protein